MQITTWIANELIVIDTDQVWAETFLHWDGFVPTATAEAIATATVRALEAGHLMPDAE